MKLETFLEKFDLFADTPDAVSELRKIILHLAVRGALVDQSDNDEPAKVTLQRLTGRKLSFLDSVELPKAWGSVALGELLILQKGKKPSTLNTDRVGLPYLDIAALERGELRQFTEDEKCPRAASGDLVIVCDGSRSGLVLDGADGVLGSTVSKISHVGFFRDYLKLFLRSLYDDLNGAKKGAAIPHLNIPRFLAISAPIPPLAEQERIVAKVDELMALCDRLEVQQQEREKRHAALAHASLARFAAAPTPATLNLIFHPSYTVSPADLRKAILTLAVQGKLVPQDPNDEPVTKLLQRLVTLTARGGKIPKPLTPIDTDALSFQIPRHWEWTQAQDLCRASHIITYGVLKPVWVEVGVPTIRVQDMQNGEIVLDGIGHCSPERAAKFSKTTLETGDIVIAKDGATLGKTAFVPASLAGGNITQHVLRFPVTPEVDRTYVRLVIDAPHGQAWMRGETKGVALPGVNVGDFRRMPIPLPPLAEQRRIVAKVEQLMALVDALETQLGAGLATAEKLLSALVAEITGTTRTGQAWKPAASSPARRGRGRPRKLT